MPIGEGRLLVLLWRSQLTADSLLSAEEAGLAMPGRPEAGAAWVEEHVVPAGEVSGVVVWRWGDVEAALASALPRGAGSADNTPVWISTATAAKRLGLARCTLDDMVDRAPRDLPGAPVPVGNGKARRHLRWDERHLDTWMAAYQAWLAKSDVGLAARPACPRPARRGKKEQRARRAHEPTVVNWDAVARDGGS